MFVFELPEIGEGVVEGEVVRWLVNAGDVVARDQPICEIMTDKATVEISSPKSGKVLRLHGRPGDVIKVHAPLMELDLGDGAAVTAPAAVAPVAAAPAAAAPVAAAPVAAAPVVAAPATPAPAAAAPVASSPAVSAPVTSGVHEAVAARMPPAPRPAGSRALASPAVRHEARKQGLDIDRVPGSGKDGRVLRADLESFQAPLPVAPPAVPAPAPSAGDEKIRIIGLRRKIAEKMTQSYRTVPHFTYVDEVDATALVALREQLNEVAGPRGVKLSYLPFIMKALVRVFSDFPTVNAVMNEEAFELTVRREVNIGIATDSDAGLYVPVVKNVERKSLYELAQEIADLSRRTREGKLKIDELQGGTFTITSVGNIGGRFATPIINHPEVAILGVNQIHERPVVLNGQIVARKMFYLSPSFDHRIIDGAVAARFVSALKELLEAPASLMLDLR